MAEKKSSRSLLRVIRFCLMVIAGGAIAVGITYRITDLQTNVLAAKPPATKDTMTEDRKLFHDLIRVKLLDPRPDGGFKQAAPDYLLVRQVAGQAPPKGIRASEQKRYLRNLYASSVGVILRQQVRLWNETRRVAGIRDDRPRGENDLVKSEWRAYSATGHPLKTGDLVPETFGFIHGVDLLPGFADWLTVADSGGTVTFRTRVKLRQPQTLMIQVVGTPIAVPPGARIEKKKGRARQWTCDTDAEAAVIRVPVQASSRGVSLSIKVKPAINCAPRMFGLAISMEKDDAGKYTKYKWRPVRRAKKTEGRFTISTADGVLLTDPSGRGTPTKQTFHYGLLNLVGFGPADASSLIGLFRRTRVPATGLEVRLTIESRMQRAAQEAINWGIGRFPKNSKFSKERKAAMILLDADTGAILAVAGHPVAPSGARPWDYASYAATRPLQDPTAVFAWEVIDKHNTPGSTFKPLVALALMREKRAKLDRIMAGLSPGGLAAATGLSPGSGTFAPAGGRRTISNFDRAAMSRYFGRNYRDDRGCKVQTTADPNFGLRQAVEFSINIWFARLAVMLDQEHIESWVRSLPTVKGWTRKTSRPPVTRLLQSMQKVGIDHKKRMDLGVNVPPELGLFRYNSPGGADILYAQVPKSAITQISYPNARPADIRALTLFIVAQNGIGQAVSVTPLHMARAVAAIASGKRVQPYLIKNWGERTLPVPDAPKLDVNPQLLTVLRSGMKAVPELTTARAAFAKSKGFRCRTYGKTGTADVEKKGYNSGWFIGWTDPPQTGGRKLAFACMLTHATGAYRFGGTACAPLVNRMLATIEKDNPEPEKTNPGRTPGPNDRPGAAPRRPDRPNPQSLNPWRTDPGSRDPGTNQPRE